MPTEPYNEFEDSSRYVDDPVRLTAEISRNGYLFLRSLIDRGKVDQVRDDIIQLLKKYGYVEKDASEPNWTGKECDDSELRQVLTATNCKVGRRIAGFNSLRAMLTSRELIGVFERLLGGEVLVWRDNFERVRVVLPGKERIRLPTGFLGSRATPAHQDGFIFRMKDGGDTPFYTAWIPLMDIDQSIGGLSLMKNSHRQGLYQHFYLRGEPRHMPLNREQLEEWKNDGAVAVDEGALPSGDEQWLRADYHPGDVLIFHRHMVHRGVSNVSNMIRLSGDFRYQRRGSPTQWQAKRTLADNFKFRARIRRHIGELGIREELRDRIAYLLSLEGPSKKKEHDIRKRIQEVAETLR